jgi:hypothetical protein
MVARGVVVEPPEIRLARPQAAESDRTAAGDFSRRLTLGEFIQVCTDDLRRGPMRDSIEQARWSRIPPCASGCS